MSAPVDSARQSGERPVPEAASRLDFHAAHGGIFFELQRRLHLLHENALRTGKRALMFVALAWGGLLVLVLPTYFSDKPMIWNFISDPGPSVRFIVGIAAFILSEKYIDAGLRTKLLQFNRAPLIAPSSQPKALSALNTALKRRDSGTAELICLLLAIAGAYAAYVNFKSFPATNWSVTVSGSTPMLTPAGWWCVCFSSPLFLFLMFRGLWRHVVWARLLRMIAALELRLTATHPDRKGGLAFLAEYPNAYVAFVFGLSSSIATVVAKHVWADGLSANALATVMIGWLLVVLVFFAYPLSAFTGPLSRLKRSTISVLSALATRQQRTVERKVIGGNVAAPSKNETDYANGNPESLADYYSSVCKISTVLLSRNSLMPVCASAILPFAIVGMTQLPFKEVFSVLKKILLV